jgi:hypothetical protein
VGQDPVEGDGQIHSPQPGLIGHRFGPALACQAGEDGHQQQHIQRILNTF